MKYEVTWVTSRWAGKDVIYCESSRGGSLVLMAEYSNQARGGFGGRNLIGCWLRSSASAGASFRHSVSRNRPRGHSRCSLPGRWAPVPVTSCRIHRSVTGCQLRTGVFVFPPRVKKQLDGSRCWAPLKWRDTNIRTGAAATTETPRSVHVTPGNICVNSADYSPEY